MRWEKLGIDNFGRLIKPSWGHEITAEEQKRFLNLRLPEVASAASVNVELASLRGQIRPEPKMPVQECRSHLHEGGGVPDRDGHDARRAVLAHPLRRRGPPLAAHGS